MIEHELDEARARELLRPLAQMHVDTAQAWQRMRPRLNPTRHRARRFRRADPARPRLVLVGSVVAVVAVVVASGVIIHTSRNARTSSGLQPAPTTAFPTGVVQPSAFTDTTGHLWVASGQSGQLTGIDPHTGALTALAIGHPDSSVVALASAGDRLYDLRMDTGQLEVRDDQTGQLITSTPDLAQTMVGDDNQLWLSTCCQQSTPTQSVTELDATNLTTRAHLLVAQEGETPQLAAGGAGVWLLSEDGTQLRRVDATATVSRTLPATTVTAPRLAVGANAVFLAIPGGDLEAINPATGDIEWEAPFGLNPDDVVPQAITVTNDTVYVAIPGHIIEFNVITHTKTGDIPINAILLTSGPHGVWATSGGTITQLRHP